MSRLLPFALVSALFLSGCVVRVKPPPRSHGTHRTSLTRVESKPRCKPSHQWDGKVCRHKGKGKGARKHDYVP